MKRLYVLTALSFVFLFSDTPATYAGKSFVLNSKSSFEDSQESSAHRISQFNESVAHLNDYFLGKTDPISKEIEGVTEELEKNRKERSSQTPAPYEEFTLYKNEQSLMAQNKYFCETEIKFRRLSLVLQHMLHAINQSPNLWDERTDQDLQGKLNSFKVISHVKSISECGYVQKPFLLYGVALYFKDEGIESLETLFKYSTDYRKWDKEKVAELTNKQLYEKEMLEMSEVEPLTLKVQELLFGLVEEFYKERSQQGQYQ
jgi:hypothetical protein